MKRRMKVRGRVITLARRTEIVLICLEGGEALFIVVEGE